MTVREAEMRIGRCVDEATGWLELIEFARVAEVSTLPLLSNAITAVQRITHNADFLKLIHHNVQRLNPHLMVRFKTLVETLDPPVRV